MSLGADISNHQGHFDVAALKRAHPDLVVLGVKAREGMTFRDAYADENFYQAERAGLVVNFYHFARPGVSPGYVAGVREAEYFWSAIKPHRSSPAFGRPVLDYEDAPDTAFAAGFCWRIQQLSGLKPMIYCPGSRTGEVPRGYPLWIAAYGESSIAKYVPRGARVFMWQYTDKLDGRNLDVSHVYVSRNALLGNSEAHIQGRVAWRWALWFLTDRFAGTPEPKRPKEMKSAWTKVAWYKAHLPQFKRRGK